MAGAMSFYLYAEMYLVAQSCDVRLREKWIPKLESLRIFLANCVLTNAGVLVELDVNSTVEAGNKSAGQAFC